MKNIKIGSCFSEMVMIAKIFEIHNHASKCPRKIMLRPNSRLPNQSSRVGRTAIGPHLNSEADCRKICHMDIGPSSYEVKEATNVIFMLQRKSQ